MLVSKENFEINKINSNDSKELRVEDSISDNSSALKQAIAGFGPPPLDIKATLKRPMKKSLVVAVANDIDFTL